MRDREKASRPSRSSTNGAEKPKTKSSSKPQPTKSGPPKSSSSGASKSSTSGTKKPTASSSKSSTATKSQSSSSRTPKTAASTTSSKSRSTVELKPEKSSSRSKPAASDSKDERSKRASDKKTSEVQGSPDSNKNDRASTKKEKVPSRGSRDPSRGDRSSSRKTEKDSSTSRSTKPSSRSKVGSERNPSRENKSSKSQERSKDRSRAPESKKSESTSSNRRVASKEKPSIKSGKDSSKSKSIDKSDTKKSSRSESEKVKDKSKSSKGEGKEKSKEETSSRKTSRSREKSAKRNSSRKEESLIEDRDSGVEGLGIQGSIIRQSPKGQPEIEAVEHNQNSLETMESGISMSTPRDLSGDEAEIEESISSKMVEVDEVAEEGLQDDDDEAMIDDSASQDAFLDESFPADLPYQNVPASLVSHSDMPKDNGGEKPEDIEESKEQKAADNDVVSKENGFKDPDVEEPDIEEDYYEDEFEDYESDFENDTVSENEEEESSSSASTPASSATPSSFSSSSEDSDEETRDPDLEAVLQAMEKENNFTYPLERVYTFDDPTQDERPSSSSVEEKKDVVQDTASKAAPQEKQNTNIQRPKTSRTFVNFAVAKKRQEAAHVNSKMNSRGRTLLSMIQLDTVSVDLLTLAPVSYEAYISSFGHSNRQQVNVQTNEDALSEEIQTDPIVMRNKWTQKPVHISVGEDNELPGPEDYMGVGGDMGPLKFTGASNVTSGTSRLTSFLTSASQVMLALLEEELVWETAESNKSDSSATSEGLGFSQPPVTLGQNVQSLLEGRTTPFVKFCPSEPNLLLSGHGLHSLGEEDIEDFKDGGLLCVWWVQEPSRPQHLLSCCSTPTAASFSPARPSLIIAGLEDGSLASWDLRESLQLHTLKINIDEDNWRVRVPSYITACDESGEGEGSSIVAIHTIKTDEDQTSDTQGAFQVVTLTANGQVTWWVVMHVPLISAANHISIGRKSATVRAINNSIAVSPHLGASPWARIVINRAATINVAHALYGDEAISTEIICHDLKMDINEPSQLYVATGSGAVAHCSRHSARIHPKAYYPEFEPGCESLCIALCPHDYRYMLVGSSDGMVRLHSISSDRPLTTWQSAPDCAPIKELQWSPARPCVFYVLDSMARLHIWDLSAGDIFPILTVEAGGLVGGALRSFNIAPTQPTSRHPLYAVFASDGGEMVLRQVGPEFSTHHLQDDYDTELERFTYYVNII